MYSANNIRCNCIMPGGYETEIGLHMQNFDQEGLDKANTIGAKYVTKGMPEELAAMALYLASPAAKNMNGACLNADGGWTC